MKSFKIKKFKKLAIMLISVLTLSSILFTMNTSVLAEVSLNLSASTTKIAEIPTTEYAGENCSNLGGLSVTSSDTNRRMYAVKSNSNQNEAVLYFFSDYNTPTKNYGKFELKNLIGHANGMAIDDNYIYITCWKKGVDDTSKNDIVRISRNEIWNKYKSNSGLQKGTFTKSSSGVTVFSAVKTDGTDYNRIITAITNYKDNGKFIINYGSLNSDVIKFTTASITNGKFVVSESAADIFTVNTGLTNTTPQDIGYDPQCGFFIARWLWNSGKSDSLKLKNTIIWIKLNSLSGNNRTYTKDNSSFRHIIINKSEASLTSYEIESIDFDCNNEMYVSVNTETNSSDSTYKTDQIIKVQRASAVDGSRKFLGSNINK